MSLILVAGQMHYICMVMVLNVDTSSTFLGLPYMQRKEMAFRNMSHFTLGPMCSMSMTCQDWSLHWSDCEGSLAYRSHTDTCPVRTELCLNLDISVCVSVCDVHNSPSILLKGIGLCSLKTDFQWQFRCPRKKSCLVFSSWFKRTQVFHRSCVIVCHMRVEVLDISGHLNCHCLWLGTMSAVIQNIFFAQTQDMSQDTCCSRWRR